MVELVPFLMVLMDRLMMGMWHHLAHMLKLVGLICSPKALISNSLSLWYMQMLNPLPVYMFVTVLSSWIILYVLLELKFSAVRKVILDGFVHGKGISLI